MELVLTCSACGKQMRTHVFFPVTTGVVCTACYRARMEAKLRGGRVEQDIITRVDNEAGTSALPEYARADAAQSRVLAAFHAARVRHIQLRAAELQQEERVIRNCGSHATAAWVEAHNFRLAVLRRATISLFNADPVGFIAAVRGEQDAAD